VAPAIKIPKVEKTNTPKGMEGVRPGSPKAVAAGFKPPKPPKAPKAPGGPPMVVSFNADGTTTLKAPAAPSVSSTTTTPTAAPTPVVDANWWTRQITSDPRFLRSDYILRGQQNTIGSKYGLSIKRDASGNAVYKSRTNPSLSNITQSGYDDAGRPVYKTDTGVVVPAGDLEMEFVEITPGEAGYGSTLVGSTNLASQGRQYGIGDVAARAGASRSGMRASSSAQETSALQSALRNLGMSAASEYAGIDQRYADLVNTIFEDLSKVAGDIVPTTPAPTSAADATAPTYAGQPTDQTTYAGYGLPKSGSPLSAGPNGDFMRVVEGITISSGAAGGGMGYDAKKKSLELVKSTYSLTPQQIRWIDNWIANNKPKPSAAPSAPSAPAATPSRPSAPANVPKPSGAGAMYERRGPWQYLGKARGWVRVG